MNTHQRGFGGLQVILVGAILSAASLVAVPQYEAHVSKAKLTEAFRLASDSKRKVSEFYVINGRFPNSKAEAAAMRTTTISPPQHVRDMMVDHKDPGHDVVIKVFLKDGVVENLDGAEQYVYFVGKRGDTAKFALQWTCGASGVDADLLPEDCA